MYIRIHISPKLPVITVPFHFGLVAHDLSMTPRKKSGQSDVVFQNKSPLKLHISLYYMFIRIHISPKLPVITVPFHFGLVAHDLSMTPRKNQVNLMWHFKIKAL